MICYANLKMNQFNMRFFHACLVVVVVFRDQCACCNKERW